MFDKFQDMQPQKPKKQKFSYLEWRKKHKKPLDMVRKYGLTLILYGTAAYFVFSFLKVNYESLKFLTKLNYTTHQISNLVENIRTHYMVYDDETETSVERLIEVDAIPQSIISEDNTLVNPYGGSIIIAPSDRLRNVKENLESTTFKMSYQGLPKDVCVNLAMMDWGDKVKGLLAVAIGSYDEKTGVDEALTDIDRKETDVKFSSFTLHPQFVDLFSFETLHLLECYRGIILVHNVTVLIDSIGLKNSFENLIWRLSCLRRVP